MTEKPGKFENDGNPDHFGKPDKPNKLCKLDKNLFRYAEDALRDYRDERERLRLLEAYLSAPLGPMDSGPVMGGEAFYEQERILERKMRSTELRGLSHKIACVECFLDTLNAADRALVRLRYFERLSWRQVAEELHASEQVCRCRWAPKVIVRAARFLFGDLAKI